MKDANLHLNYFSFQDLRWGRIGLVGHITAFLFILYFEPGYIHETVELYYSSMKIYFLII